MNPDRKQPNSTAAMIKSETKVFSGMDRTNTMKLLAGQRPALHQAYDGKHSRRAAYQKQQAEKNHARSKTQQIRHAGKATTWAA